MDVTAAQARLHKLEEIMIPGYAKRIGQTRTDPQTAWRPVTIDAAATCLEELADPESDPARREAVLEDVRRRLSAARSLRAATPDTSSPLALALDSEIRLWEKVLDGALKNQAGYVLSSYLPSWRHRHATTLNLVALRMRDLDAAFDEAADLRSALQMAGAPTDPDSLRRAYEAHRGA